MFEILGEKPSGPWSLSFPQMHGYGLGKQKAEMFFALVLYPVVFLDTVHLLNALLTYDVH